MKLLVILFSLSSFVGISQSRIITARILDSQTKLPIRNATVTISEQDSTVFSNYLGYFQASLATNDKLIISHIGYITSEVKIPENNSFAILLEKQYAKLGRFDLSSFPLQQTQSSKTTLHIDNDISNIKNSALYKDNWQKFYEDLGELIIKSSSFNKLDSVFDVNILFTINELGNVENVSILDASISETLTEKEVIRESLLSLNHWTPATQNGNMSSQFFELGISRNKDIFTIVEEPASPTGGYQSFYNYINSNLRYPAEARRIGFEGKVYVQFVVDKDGSLTEVQVVKGIGAGCDEEAVRVVENSPHWYPPYQRGKPVKQRIILPITFNSNLINSQESISFNQYVSSRVRYPRQARKMGVEGTVYVTFQIDETEHHINNINILNNIQTDFGNEIRIVLNSVPRELIENNFKPDQVYILPVTFGLDKYPNNITEVILPQGQKLDEIVVIVKESFNSYGPTINLNSGTKNYLNLDQALIDNPNTQRLSLVNKGLNDISPEISKFKKLIYLDMEGNNITQLPKEFTELNKLQELYLPNNKISSLPDQFYLLSSLKIIGLANNNLSKFPKQLAELSKLEALDLSANDISSIPKEINKLKKLKILVLNDNNIAELPSEIYKLKNLDKIYLINNGLNQTQIEIIKDKFKKTKIITE